MFVGKGRKGCVILFVESIRFLGLIINQFSKEICFHFLFINFMVFMKGGRSMSLGSTG